MADFSLQQVMQLLIKNSSWLAKKARFVWFVLASFRNVQEMNKDEFE